MTKPRKKKVWSYRHASSDGATSQSAETQAPSLEMSAMTRRDPSPAFSTEAITSGPFPLTLACVASVAMTYVRTYQMVLKRSDVTGRWRWGVILLAGR